MEAYKTETAERLLELDGFIEKYRHAEKFMAYCRQCPNYNSVWSCPPLSFDAEALLKRYKLIYLRCTKILLAPEIIASADTADKAKALGRRIIESVKTDVDNELLGLEKRVPRSLALSSGGCTLCGECARKHNLPCRRPEKMRYSLDAFGIDLTAAAKDIFAVELQWSQGRLPEYFTLLSGLLTDTEIEGRLWETGP